MSQLIDQAFQLALENLQKNRTKFGLVASRSVNTDDKPPYDYLFPRDTGVSVFGLMFSDDPEMLELARVSIESLAIAQSDKGQFPQSYRLDSNRPEWWHPGTVDSTLWWSIALLKYFEKTGDRAFFNSHRERLERAFTWLTYQDTNNDSLLEQGEAAGWDDEFPRHGTVLYTNALWYWLVRLRVEVEGREELKVLQDKIREGVNTFLWVHKGDDHTRNYFPENDYTRNTFFSFRLMEWVNAQAVVLPYYLGYVSHLSFEMRCDVYGNILACLSGLADDKRKRLIVDFIFRAGINVPFPVKVLYPPIYPGENDWRPYMSKGRQNYPWQYHNGGIWPYVGGFWVVLLAQMGHPKAHEELEKLAKAASLNDWEFNEYLHGQNGTPMGMTFQTWNMAMYVAAYKAVSHTKAEQQTVPVVSMDELTEIRDRLTDALRAGAEGRETALPFIRQQMPDGPVVQKDETFQVIVIGGSVYKNVLMRKLEGYSMIDHLEEGNLPTLDTKEGFLEFVGSLADRNVNAIAINFAHAIGSTLRNGLVDGKLLFGAKEHTLTGLEGKFVGETIEQYLAETQHRTVRVSVANDTVCLLLSSLRRYEWNRSACGIVGTGLNFAMFADAQTAINLESGEFGDFPLSEAAKLVDERSANPGSGLLEKEIAGAYLYQAYNIYAERLGVAGAPLTATRELDKIATDPNHPGHQIALALLERSAALVAAQVAAIMAYHDCDIVFNMLGSLFWKASGYEAHVEKYTAALSSHRASFVSIMNSEVYGAAQLVA
ncbi:MAG: hypothetical protein N2691_02145 [Patescibacteria group bacterium]|nr:hypothetical protein [Patescibacteria group bacterium]